MGLINIVFDLCFLLLLVRAVVPNEGHMAFNRPYQRMLGVMEPVWSKLRVPERQAGSCAALILLALIGFRGFLWWMFGTHQLDFKVIYVHFAHANLLQAQALSVVAAIVFLLQVYAFLTLAILIGGLENRTDHHSRLMRALLGPLKKMPPSARCFAPALALVLFWTIALWVFALMGITPVHRFGVVGCALGAVPVTLALIIDLARVWIVLLIVRSVMSFVPVWRPSVVETIERVTDPVLRPFRRLPLRAGQFDFTPIVAILVLALLHHLLIEGLASPVQAIPGLAPPLRWLYEQA